MCGYQRHYELLCTLPDPLGRRRREHILAEVLFVTLVAVLAGCNNAEDVCDFLEENEAWFRKIPVLPGGIPAHDMALRALAIVDPDELERVLRTWVDAIRAPGVLTSEGGRFAFNGKALRGSPDKSSGLGAIQLVGAYLIDNGLTLGTIKVDDKSNEITAIPELIRGLNLKGATVTIDAMAGRRKSRGKSSMPRPTTFCRSRATSPNSKPASRPRSLKHCVAASPEKPR